MNTSNLFYKKFRKALLSILKAFSKDILIKHHKTGKLFLLHSYKHKGYWYYGKRREQNSMKIFSEIIKSGMNVLEIGGHIGYLTTYYSYLVGQSGKVVVFEPGKNNLKYLYSNVKNSDAGNVIIEEFAAGNQNCTMTFYLDPITGQNNTLVKNFEGFEKNREFSAEPDSEYLTDSVQVVRLDDYLINKELPDFIKIDIEGYEWECIEGLKVTIEKHRPYLMIEIQANSEKIINYFLSLNYKIYNDIKKEISNMETFEKVGTPNIFFYP